ncbi:uncharacterized protein LDX57_005012 [Aspergillus melleus]|uniref:uncharacterized protein n=1 Tax=Aspergillus melleus TaxID=138277 RepID=UPI001E8CC181|nr:uncharacterized protein LDX57_005012 [Aspergillus melleus]KAH8427298.1 hypothetical protein LDX57_005012 [Aspergillus melleus]
MSGKVPHAAFCEEYDEDAHVILPGSRQVANLAAKRSKSDLRSSSEPLVDVASDSGYSSRTAATVNSTQSGPSGRKSPVPLKVDTSLKRSDLDRVRSHRKERPRERVARPAREEKMQVGAYPPGVSHHPPPPPMQRSPSRSRSRRESAHLRHYPGTCWECDQGLYHASTPAEPRSAMDYPAYYMSQPSTPSVHDFPPPSPQTPRYPPSVGSDVHVASHSSSRSHGRSGRSDTYHATSRPMSFHGMMPGMMYNSGHLGRPDHGPPLSSSAYANAPPYASSYYSQQSPYFPVPDYAPSEHHHQERSLSRTREHARGRRSSTYGTPVVDYDHASAYDEDEPVEHVPSRESRPRLPSHSSHERDEDYYRMPPPPLKHKATPHIIQKRPDLPRKSATTTAITAERRPSRSMDMSEIRDALPEYGYRRSSRETVMPERSRGIRDARRSTSYHDSARPARIAVENSRRRRPTVYYNDEGGDDVEEKQREAEEYQASRSGKSGPMPLTADLLRAKASSQRAESDSGSQKSRSNSSRGSDARTQNGSGVGTNKPEDDNNIVMTMNGVTMSFTQESVGGKRISVRTGDTGAVELNIEGKRPQKYLTGGSDYTGSVARRELESSRRARTDRRSDQVSRRSSRSTYSGRTY